MAQLVNDYLEALAPLAAVHHELDDLDFLEGVEFDRLLEEEVAQRLAADAETRRLYGL